AQQPASFRRSPIALGLVTSACLLVLIHLFVVWHSRRRAKIDGPVYQHCKCKKCKRKVRYEARPFARTILCPACKTERSAPATHGPPPEKAPYQARCPSPPFMARFVRPPFRAETFFEFLSILHKSYTHAGNPRGNFLSHGKTARVRFRLVSAFLFLRSEHHDVPLSLPGPEAWLHAGGVTGGDRHHCRAGQPALAGHPESTRGRRPRQVQKQLPLDRSRRPQF